MYPQEHASIHREINIWAWGRHVCLRGYGYMYSFYINMYMLVYLYANSFACMCVFDGCIVINMWVVPVWHVVYVHLNMALSSVSMGRGSRGSKVFSNPLIPSKEAEHSEWDGFLNWGGQVWGHRTTLTLADRSSKPRRSSHCACAEVSDAIVCVVRESRRWAVIWKGKDKDMVEEKVSQPSWYHIISMLHLLHR